MVQRKYSQSKLLSGSQQPTANSNNLHIQIMNIYLTNSGCKHHRLSSWLNKVNTNFKASWFALQCSRTVRQTVYFNFKMYYYLFFWGDVLFIKNRSLRAQHHILMNPDYSKCRSAYPQLVIIIIPDRNIYI